MEEGPFGEYTGYYSGVGTDPRNFIDVKCVTHRNNPILWGTTVGRAVTDTHMTMALSYGATLWQQLLGMKIPGLKAVYCPPEGSGRFLAIISMKQMYPGHADQVLTAAISTEMGAYGLKTVIVVDEDIDPWDIPRGYVRLEFPVPAQPVPGDQARTINAAGSFSAHRGPGNHRPAAAGCDHSL